MNVHLCFDFKSSYNAILYISKTDTNCDPCSKRFIVDAGGEICQAGYTGQIEFDVAELQVLDEAANRIRAEKCYKTLEIKDLWEKWRDKKYVSGVDIFELLKS